jgi:asparagine synthase (glutamine-hydrolysing)
MCGICGFATTRASLVTNDARGAIEGMANSLASRGPDDFGTWLSPEGLTALGHRRLSIIDLSTAGHQPMASLDGRFVITYNGEIYNYKELRLQLERSGCKFRGGSDTEVLLQACATWGVETAVTKSIGIFAFGLWDQTEHVLSLARDHLGVKPLYWARFDGGVGFASQLKAFKFLPGWVPELDLESVAAFHSLGYLAQQRTIYRDTHKLLPGSILTWSPGREPREKCYYDLREVARKGQANQFSGHFNDAVLQLEKLLLTAVDDQMVSDVPIGAFLSGGIDSSTVVACMQAQRSTRVKTFTIGYNEQRFNEAEYAKAVARHLGTDHTTLYVEPRHALDIIPGLPEWFDEPFADPSQIPTYLLSRLTRGSVTVALSGDGGDELFAGYKRYFQARKAYQMARWLPGSVRSLAAWGMRVAAPAILDHFGRHVLPTAQSIEVGHRLHKAAALVLARSCEEALKAFVVHWPQDIVLGSSSAGEPATALGTPWLSDPIARMQLFESMTWLPEDVLAKTDRASMSVGLEARVPLLDPRIVEFSWQLPASFKMRGGQGKLLLREVLHRFVPAHLTDRPKMGFGVPMGEWLRGPLRDWSEDLLDEKRLQQQGLLNVATVRKHWLEHVNGLRNWQFRLWHVLMFQAWHRYWH